MARLWSSGFELNSVTSGVENTIANGSPSISSGVVRSGVYSLRITSLLSGTPKYVNFQYLTSEATSNTYFRFYITIVTLPTAENRILITNDSTGSVTSPSVYITLDSGGLLRLYDEDGAIGSASSALSLNRQYLIEVKSDTTPAGGSQEIRAKLDGVEFAGSSTRNIVSTNQPFVLYLGGNLNSEGQTTGDWYFDDIAINNSSGSFQNSYPGSGKIIHLKPDSAGDNSDWTNTYTNVDEVTPDDATTLVSSNTLDQIDDHNVEASNISSSDTVNVVQVGVRFNGAGASANASFVLRIKASASGTVEESSAITPSNTTWVTNAAAAPRNYSLTLYDLPGASTTAWTQTDLDSAQIGYRLSATSTNAAQISTVWLLVDYTPSTLVFDASSSTQGDTVSSLTFAHTCTGTNRLLVVVSAVEANATPTNRPITGVTYNSVALTKADDELYTSGGGEDDAVELWYLYAPDTGSNNVVITYTGTVEGAIGGAMSFTNAAQSGTPAVSSTSATSVGPATTDTTTTVDNSIVVAVAATMSSSRVLTPSTGIAGAAEILDITNTGQNVMSAGWAEKGVAGTQTTAWTVDASADWLIVAAAFAPYVAAGGGGSAPANFVFQTTNQFWGS